MFRNWWVKKLSPVLRDLYLKERPDNTCRILVETLGNKSDKVVNLLETSQGILKRELYRFPFLAAEIPYVGLEKLAASPLVVRLWHDTTVFSMLDKVVASLGGSDVQDIGYTGKGVVIALLDTGIYLHEDLITPNNRILAWNDLVKNQNAPYDDNGHGTYVAGSIAGNGKASGGRLKGMAPEAWLVGLKVLGRDGTGLLSDLTAGIEWCIENQAILNIKIMNLSLGTVAQDSYYFDPLSRAVSMAWRKGITVFTAVENQSQRIEQLNSPGINPWIIKVAPLNEEETFLAHDRRLDGFSRNKSGQRILIPDLVAPGENITSINTNEDYSVLSGASIATPLVAGGAALILQKYPSYQPNRLKYLLLKKVRDLGLGRSLQGAGMLAMNKMFPNARKKKNKGFSIIPNMGQLFKLLSSLLLTKDNFENISAGDNINNILFQIIRYLSNSSSSLTTVSN